MGHRHCLRSLIIGARLQGVSSGHPCVEMNLKQCYGCSQGPFSSSFFFGYMVTFVRALPYFEKSPGPPAIIPTGFPWACFVLYIYGFSARLSSETIEMSRPANDPLFSRAHLLLLFPLLSRNAIYGKESSRRSGGA